MGGGGLSPGTTQFLRCRGQSLRWHSLLQYRTSLQRAQGLNRIYKGAFAPAPMFNFALSPQASQRSLGQPWLFILFWRYRCVSALAACQGLELAGCGGVQGCFGGALATSNARLDLVVSRDEVLLALMMVASSLALDKNRQKSRASVL